MGLAVEDVRFRVHLTLASYRQALYPNEFVTHPA